MKFINKIKAFFRKWDEDVELDLFDGIQQPWAILTIHRNLLISSLWASASQE